MKLINTNAILDFIAEGGETEAELAFIERMQPYIMKQYGAMVRIMDRQDERLITCINPFDNTQFICTDSGYDAASDFGAKRFLVSEARALLNDEKTEHPDVIQFPRDLSFPVEKREEETAVQYHRFDLAGALAQFRSDRDKFYVLLSELFSRCADFTPGKQDEYSAGGRKQDKYCRFNLMNNEEKQAVSTKQVFLMDDDSHIVGTISATLIHGHNGGLDIYFYDEIVDYFILLNAGEIERLYALSGHLRSESDDAEKLKLEREIAALIEPKRMHLMAQLFAAAREGIRDAVSDLDEKIAAGQVHAFIRAAAGREHAYAELGCSKMNTGNFVIHGAPTPQLKMLDAHIKSWAAEQLQDLQPRINRKFMLSGSPETVADSNELLNTQEAMVFRK